MTFRAGIFFLAPLPENAVNRISCGCAPHPGIPAILRNINRLNIGIQNNPGFIRTIAHFVNEHLINPVLSGSSHFTARKWMVYGDSVRENPIATKIFINS